MNQLRDDNKPVDVVPCRFCGAPTYMTGIKLCDRCWELEHRIRANPELARVILRQVDEAVNTETI